MPDDRPKIEPLLRAEGDAGRGEGPFETGAHRTARRPQAPVRILVIDDDEADRLVIARALRKVRPGIQIVEATTAAEGLDRLDEAAPDLVLLDLRMPGVDGFSVLKSAKTGAERADVPVVVLSTSSNPDDVRRAYRLNANAYVQKPSTLDEYERLARRLVDFWVETAVRL
ncbi:MAG TPA: response regulator [Methylomirabilota bacterium]|nr:response regulator [Methylomirabilota bacterium]